MQPSDPTRPRRDSTTRPPRHRRCRWPRVAALALIAWVCPQWERSANAEAITIANVTAELVSEQETIRPGEAFTVGIALRPSPGWHTYWQNSGDSGLPTRVEWKLPPEFRAGELEWPHPVRLSTPPFVTFGYEGDALLLTRIDAPASLRAGSEVEVVAVARWLACREDACVPGKADLPLRVRVETTAPLRDSRWDAAFDTARAQLPRTLEGWSATAGDAGDKVRIEVAAAAQARPSTTGIQVFPLAARVIDASAQPSVRATDSGFVVEIAKEQNAAALPDPLALVLVADGGWDATGSVRALRIDARVSAVVPKDARVSAVVPKDASVGAVVPKDASVGAVVPMDARVNVVTAKDASAAAATARPAGDAASPTPLSPPLAAAAGLTLWTAVALAFLGGLVLNLMPCVFPVLSLKVLGFIHVAHHDAAIVRRHGYAFTAGVILSFWILAGLLLALRAAGGVFGWGFQLQEPLFVALLAALLLAMALNLLGVFALGASVSGVVGRFDSESGYHGSFLSGVLATLLATPCSAPFMGTAIGYALVQPPSVALAVFTSLGAGMASPYLVLSCAPSLIRSLPRPGAWMERFREAMAFPLLATVVWLVWVFGQQTGNDGVLRLLLALLLASMAAWTGGRLAAGRRQRGVRVLTGLLVAAAAALVVSASSPLAPGSARQDVAAGDSALKWLPWNPDDIGRHRSEGRVVFVDFTADWCLSCKVNERIALTGTEFASSMAEANAVAMKADWTSADPRITQALEAFGRSGVPLYVVYPRDPSRQPIVLPQILTPAVVRDALARAVV